MKITRHIKVKGHASPDDPNLSEYWEQRATNYGKTYFASGSKLHLVAQSQNWKCPVCGDPLFNGEPLHTHHKITVNQGGTDELEDLIHLYKTCHIQIHGNKQTAMEA